MFDFAGMAAGFSGMLGGPYFASVAITQGEAVTDEAGDIITPASPTVVDCLVQRDVCTERMRADGDFKEKDCRLIITGIDELTTAAQIIISTGPHAGTYALRSVDRDPAAFGWDCRGRAA